ncbi:MAG: ATP-binding protein [Candidatus Sumerlaeota bacterium]|nr:ATP-binding protein [Candidatus Sumerlaeota bacterium]
MTLSLRSRLILSSSLISALALVSAGILLYYYVRHNLIAEFDRALIDKAQMLAAGAELDTRTSKITLQDVDLSEFKKKRHPDYLKIWLDKDKILYSSPSLNKQDLKLEFRKPQKTECSYLRLPGGRIGRVVFMSFTLSLQDEHENTDAKESGKPVQALEKTPDRSQAVIALVRDAERITEALERLGMFLSLSGLATIIITAGVLWFVIRWNMRPLNRVAAQIERMDERALVLNVETEKIPAELRPVVERLKGLLQRLEQAFTRERAFSADIAHELRTPLAGLMTAMEVSLSRPREPVTYRATFGECLTIVSQMKNMVEKLLSLARLESGQTPTHPEIFPLDDAVREAWKPLEKIAKERDLAVEWRLDPTLALETDQDLWILLTRNILENAVSYADSEGAVRIETRQDENNAVFYVSNTGSQIPQEETERLFERLTRGDAARSATGVHCGLGLSLVRKTAALLGGEVRVQSSVGGLFEVTITMPIPVCIAQSAE